MEATNRKFLVLKDPFSENTFYHILQTEGYHLIGRIYIFKKNEKGEAKRREFLSTTKPEITGKATGYRVYCRPYSSIHPVRGMMAEEIRMLMAEMADYYVSLMTDGMRMFYED